MKMRNILIFLIVLLLNVDDLFAQNRVIEAGEELKDLLTGLYEFIEETRTREQSQILDYCNLPGTFWVMENPEVFAETGYSFRAYIFLNNNYVIEVVVFDGRQVTYVYNEEILPLSPVFFIQIINGALKYNIVDGKIVVYGKVFCYLEDTFLFFFSSKNEEFRKYRLYKRFPVHEHSDKNSKDDLNSEQDEK
jgi:hypothetical protein